MKDAARLIRILDQRMLARRRRSRINPVYRRVKIRRVELVDAVRNHIVQRQRRSAEELLIHSKRIVQRVRTPQIRSRRDRLVAARRSTTRAGCKVLRSATGRHSPNDLSQNLVLAVRFESGHHITQLITVVEDPEAGIQHSLRSASRTPHSVPNGNARSKVVMVRKMILRLVTEAVADR